MTNFEVYALAFLVSAFAVPAIFAIIGRFVGLHPKRLVVIMPLAWVLYLSSSFMSGAAIVNDDTELMNEEDTIKNENIPQFEHAVAKAISSVRNNKDVVPNSVKEKSIFTGTYIAGLKAKDTIAVLVVPLYTQKEDEDASTTKKKTLQQESIQSLNDFLVGKYVPPPAQPATPATS